MIDEKSFLPCRYYFFPFMKKEPAPIFFNDLIFFERFASLEEYKQSTIVHKS